MKKLFSAFTAVLLAFCFISCAPQELSDRSSKNEGSVSLSIQNTRTISPAEGISYKDVPEWTVTFQDTTAKYDVITVENVNFNSSPQEIRLPLGTYNVTLNGTANATSGETAQPVHFYGEASVTVKKDEIVPISVFVAPKKSDGGKGSFNFTVTTSGFENNPPSTNIVDISTGRNNYFTVSLTPYGGENPVATWTPTKITTSSSTETESVYSFSVSSDTLESKSVPSGIYTLSIKYTWVVGEDSDGQLLTKTKEIYYLNHDFFVEIIDELETTGSVNITVSLVDSKTYYATTDTSIGNGAFKSMPKNLDELLVDINRTTISEANIYMVDSLDIDTLTITYPEIDVSKVNEKGKTYCIYTKSEKEPRIYNNTPSYTITGAAVEGGEPTIDIDSSVRTVTLKNSSSSSSGIANIVSAGRPEFVLKDNTSIFIDLTDGQNQIVGTTICMPPDSTTFDSYYVENPCVTVKNFSTTQTSFSVFVEQSLSNSYSVVTNSSDDVTYKTTNFYIIPSYKAELPVTGIPNYDLVVKKDDQPVTGTQFYVGDTVTITATSESEDGSFAADTSFAWFINGKKTDCTAQSYTIKFGEGDAVAENTIICLVGYNKEYLTKSIKLTAQENTIVLYNNTSDTGKPALSYATLKDSSVLSSNSLITKDTSTKIVDYCFYNSNNLYAIVRNTGGTATIYSINKYTYNNGDNTSTTYTIGANENVSAIDYIEASNDGKLYAVITRSTESTTSTSIAELDLTSSNDTVGFTDEYALPTNWPSGDNTYYYIQTFCTDGTNFYFILLRTSPETSSYNLVSCTVSNSQLTETTSILLASTDESDTSPVFSNYGDALEYKDLCCINNKLYLLVRDVVTEGYNNTSYSRGALCTFTVGDNGKITAGKMDTGYQKTSRSFSYTGSYDQATDSYPTITRTAYIGDVDSKLFYGPVKFVARKQDELIIADDGFSIKVEDYTDHQGHTQATVSSKNAVVTYNLKTESLNFVSLDGEYFEEKYSGYFYSSGFFNQ